ncbi:hypothetical protein PAQ31011_00207 [Pandoraea aquatica]|uniref:Uncharacterized protein n=1 Tax=Pandoraea aquatica TaxID=2508290 RepID=A0A5E4RLJ5_9BURK|nr:hypothetical protein PAQ31011_00207 [Pandoraea aquatica]
MSYKEKADITHKSILTLRIYWKMLSIAKRLNFKKI